ncbi:MAG: Na/Pi cotransporter family protein [Rhizobiaceae bacterium]|nr:Na/Pi cotransporter family protein [Rhizobiaceae bacterium]MCV0408014.1 Na/Pi cotransporter family protein [Rhizobiaceae bacterium]
MSGSLVLLHLAGAVALLLYATRMVRTGVERAYGDTLRRRLRDAIHNPLAAIGAGTALAICLQSATAVTLLVGSFVASGFVGGASGLIAVLGADLGSSLVVRIVSLDLSLLVPVALFAGTAIFMTTERRAWRQFGRILIGIGLLLLSLRLIGEASDPLRESRLLPVIVNFLAGDPVSAFLMGAALTWLFHSSVAFLLLVASLAARGLVPADLGVVLVLGANLGGGVIAAVLARASTPPARTVPVGNLIMRATGAVLALIAFVQIAPPLDVLGGTASAQIIHAHIAFNLLLALLAMPFVTPVHALASRLVAMRAPVEAEPLAATEQSALDKSVLARPALALGNAAREVMRICETIEVMLARIIELYEAPSREGITELATLDDRVDSRHAAVKLYLARIPPGAMSSDDAARCSELLEACVKLEQVGDIIVRNMLPQVRKKLDRKVEFTPEGWRELSSFHASVLANARMAFNVLVSRDAETAREIVREKDRLRDREKETSSRHFMRLREGAAASVETSSIHLDTIRDLKQINSLLASLAYPVLEEQGLLGGTRLRAV